MFKTKYALPNFNIRKREGSALLRRKYAVRISQAVYKTIKGSVKNDPVAKQYIPQDQELQILPEERLDPIGDEAHTPVQGIVHRYPDRVLFKPANVCAVYCRYCFRREMVGKRGADLPDILSDKDIENALNYIRAHKEIWEVILTGGDPLVLSPRQLAPIMRALNDIEHVKVIRIHTRVPIADPARITPALIKALGNNADRSVSSSKALYMALHINHAQEITQEVRASLQALHARQINLLSQSVLLKGVNNDAQILEELFRELVALNVKPYYIHHPDLAPGTSHFRLSIEEGQEIMRALQGRTSGLCQPTYMLDIPGGHGKIPLTPCMITNTNGAYELENYKGEHFTYPPKNNEAT